MYHNDTSHNTSLRGTRILNEINIKIPGENNRLLLYIIPFIDNVKNMSGAKCDGQEYDSVSKRVSEEKSRRETRNSDV